MALHDVRRQGGWPPVVRKGGDRTSAGSVTAAVHRRKLPHRRKAGCGKRMEAARLRSGGIVHINRHELHPHLWFLWKPGRAIGVSRYLEAVDPKAPRHTRHGLG